jgi:hypothetical protein
MIRGIFYKEWLKTKWFVFIGLILTFTFLFIWYQTLSSDYAKQQAVYFVFSIAAKNRLYQSALKILPPIFALALALFQFVPEIGSYKYRLTILLPFKENKLIALMTGYGYMVYIGFSLVILTAFYFISAHFLPSQLIIASSANIFTWILAGYFTYTWLTAILFEPKWKNRIFLSVIGFTAVALALWKTENSTTVYMNVILSVYALLSYAVPYFTIYRLRKGRA